MQKALLLSVASLSVFTSFAQIRNSDKVFAKDKLRGGTAQPPITVKGEIIGKEMVEDSIFFVAGRIDPKYFEIPIPPAKITANTFVVKAAVRYPQMRRILLKSDKGKKVYRRGEYFIDASTTSITVDYLAQECNQVTGVTAAEYRNKFIPFFYKANTVSDCHQQRFDDLVWDETSQYDSTLSAYVKANPTSYVALWSLIERFSQFGHSQVRESTLAGFSQSVKSSKLWQTANEDMRQALIKQGGAFPSFSVKGVSQPDHMMRLPNAQYTLIDFWFSRCRPCLETFPVLKRMYTTYQAKGFEIVSISTDKTQEVPLWQKRIQEYELPWVQYLDENAVASSKLAVYSFPTTFLLDHDGKVLLRNVSPEELEKFLAENLGQ